MDFEARTLLDLGGCCYALDQIVQRLIESVQHRERFIERLNTEKESLNSNLRKAEEQMRRSSASSKSGDKYEMLKLSYE